VRRASRCVRRARAGREPLGDWRHIEAFAGLIGAVIGGVLVLVGDFGRRRAEARQSQVQRLTDAATEFSIQIAQLVGDLRDAHEKGLHAGNIPSRRGRYEAMIRLHITPGCEELRDVDNGIRDAYWKVVAELHKDDAAFRDAVSAYFDAQIEFERKVQSIIRRGRIKADK
jgi:hypothetical protein